MSHKGQHYASIMYKHNWEQHNCHIQNTLLLSMISPGLLQPKLRSPFGSVIFPTPPAASGGSLHVLQTLQSQHWMVWFCVMQGTHDQSVFQHYTVTMLHLILGTYLPSPNILWNKLPGYSCPISLATCYIYMLKVCSVCGVVKSRKRGQSGGPMTTL